MSPAFLGISDGVERQFSLLKVKNVGGESINVLYGDLPFFPLIGHGNRNHDLVEKHQRLAEARGN
jgi:hypothetical protein